MGSMVQGKKAYQERKTTHLALEDGAVSSIQFLCDHRLLQHEWAAGVLTACENNIIQLNTCQEKQQLLHKFSFQAMRLGVLCEKGQT